MLYKEFGYYNNKTQHRWFGVKGFRKGLLPKTVKIAQTLQTNCGNYIDTENQNTQFNYTIIKH